MDLGIRVGQSVTVRQEMILLGPFSHSLAEVWTEQSSLLPHPGGPVLHRCVLRDLLWGVWFLSSALGKWALLTTQPAEVIDFSLKSRGPSLQLEGNGNLSPIITLNNWKPLVDFLSRWGVYVHILTVMQAKIINVDLTLPILIPYPPSILPP